MSDYFRYFRSSILFTVAGLIFGGWVGHLYSPGWRGFISGLFLTFVLAVLEISLSFDNAVVNATLLREMDQKWKRRFLTWGMPVAVFGMRVVFPLLVVSLSARIDPWSAIVLATSQPAEYEKIMLSAHLGLTGFGSAFLMMVALGFFLNPEKSVHWFHPLEASLLPLGKSPVVLPAICLTILGVVAAALPERAEALHLFAAGVLGVSVFVVMGLVTRWLSRSVQGGSDSSSSENRVGASPASLARLGAVTFVQLEFLDASFSFDGVIGAFAVTNNLFIIAAGLGIGAMFVRSLTIMLVDRRTLEEFRYLEHGAFYAIALLAILMLLDIFVPVPEVVTGLTGAALILTALRASGKHTDETT